MHFKVGFKTDIGRKRSQNQDSGAAHSDLGLFLVSDGMGGHRGGEIASATAVHEISERVRIAEQKKGWESAKVIQDAIRSANLVVYQKAVDQPDLQGMGTTTTALLFEEGLLSIGHVGDSRCYFFHSNSLWQATRDHSLVQEKLRAGLITRSQVKTDRMKNVITRSVGFEKQVDVEIYQMEVQSGDHFLVCSDGLSGMVEDSEIMKILQRELFEGGDIQKAVEALVAAANTNGGDDNVTAILVQVE